MRGHCEGSLGQAGLRQTSEREVCLEVKEESPIKAQIEEDALDMCGTRKRAGRDLFFGFNALGYTVLFVKAGLLLLQS